MVLCAFGSLLNLFWRWREYGSIGTVYRDCKHSIALTVTFGSIGLLVAAKWWLRHAENHGMAPPAWSPYAGLIIAFGTVAAAIGGLCWMRVTLPGLLGFKSWLLMLLGCLAFGVGMAL